MNRLQRFGIILSVFSLSLLATVSACIASQSVAETRDDCDYLMYKRLGEDMIGTALIDSVRIKSENLPDPIEYKKVEIAFVHFQQKPHQPEDMLQLVNGTSRKGNILDLDPVNFRLSGSTDAQKLSRSKILTIVFRCSIDKAVKEYEKKNAK